MHSVRIENEHSPYFARFWATYEDSFPPSERRARAAQTALFERPEFRLDAWLEGSAFLGFMAWWDFGDYRYVEHVAVSPEARSGGNGGKILRTWMNKDPRPVYLEIEEPVDDVTRRRLGFYQRLGFLRSEHRHIQPPYQAGFDPAPMLVLSWPDMIAPEQYARLIRMLRTDVWAGMA